jgi:hypothetical protein
VVSAARLYLKICGLTLAATCGNKFALRRMAGVELFAILIDNQQLSIAAIG